MPGPGATSITTPTPRITVPATVIAILRSSLTRSFTRQACQGACDGAAAKRGRTPRRQRVPKASLQIDELVSTGMGCSWRRSLQSPGPLDHAPNSRQCPGPGRSRRCSRRSRTRRSATVAGCRPSYDRETGYPGDSALSRLSGVPDAQERDASAAICRASRSDTRSSRPGHHGGCPRGNAHRLRDRANSRQSRSTAPQSGTRRVRCACRSGEPTPAAPILDRVPDEADVPARRRPRNEDVHLP